MKEATVWIVGKHITQYEEGPVWEIQGVYDTEQKAVDSCTFDNYFVGPMKMNVPSPNKCVEWSGMYYPSEKK